MRTEEEKRDEKWRRENKMERGREKVKYGERKIKSKRMREKEYGMERGRGGIREGERKRQK